MLLTREVVLTVESILWRALHVEFLVQAAGAEMSQDS
jgi:hypothetical protein